MKRLKNVKDKNLALKIVRERGILIEYLTQWQDDKDVALAAVTEFPFALEHVSSRLKADKDVVLAAIEKEPRVLSFADYTIYNDDEIREQAFKINKGGFIVDPEAFEEFLFQDSLMMKRVYRSNLIIDQSGKRSWDKSNYIQALDNDPFYKRFKKFYQADVYHVSAWDIRKYEEILLNMKYCRQLEKENTDKESKWDVIGL